jgi:hypothetical protein
MRLGRRALIVCALLGCAAEADSDGVLANDDGVLANDDGVLANDDGASAVDDGTPVGDDRALRCIADNPPADPFDVGDVVVPSPAPGSVGPAPVPPSADTIAAECVASGGTGCDPSRFISKAAASCLAESSGFEAGLEPWSLALVYHHGHDRVVWNVMSVVNDGGREGYSGGVLTLDATDGDVLGRNAYTATP